MPVTTIRKNKDEEKKRLLAEMDKMNEDAFNELDDDDDDDGDDDDSEEEEDESEEEEEEEDSPPVAVVAAPKVENKPAKRRGRPPKNQVVTNAPPVGRGRPPTRGRAYFEDAFDEFMEQLEFGPDEHKLSIYRLEPVYDMSGNKIKGHLDTFQVPIGVDEIKQRYGGGTYEVKIMGPHPQTGKGSVIKTVKKIEIAGAPRDSVNPAQQQQAAGAADSANLEILKALIEAKDRDLKRTYEDSEKKEKMLYQLLNKDDGSKDTLVLMMQLMDKADKEKRSSVDSLMAEMREERRIQAEREREERREREAKEAREREERRREEQERDRKWREEQLELQRRHETQLQQLQLKMQQDANSSSKNAEFMLQFLEKKSEEDRTRSAELMGMQFQLMQEGSRQTVDMMVKAQGIQNSMLTEALKEAKNTKKGGNGLSDLADQVTTLMSIKSLLSGDSAAPEESVAEKIMNRAEAFLPSLGETVAKVMTARSFATPPRKALPPPQMAYVDEDEEELVNMADQNTVTPKPQTTQQPQQPVKQEVDESDMESADNDFTEFHFPDDGASLDITITCLVKNMDLAIRNGMAPKQIVDEVLSKFPAKVVFLLKSSSADELIGFLEPRVPTHWMIASPKGEQILRAVHTELNK